MELFLLRILIAFLSGAAVVTGVTCLAERCNPRMAGILSALPTTIVGGLVFIMLTSGMHAVSNALVIAPTMIIGVIAFVLGFVHTCHKGAMWGLVGGSVLWWMAVFLALHLPHVFFLHLALFSVFYLGVALYVGKFPDKKAPRLKASPSELFARALLAGSAMSLVVVSTKLGGPLWGGVFAAGFPAVILCTLFLMTKRHGAPFTSAIARAMPHGSAGSAAFVAVLYLTTSAHPNLLGFCTGLMLGYGAALGVSAGMGALFKRTYQLALYSKFQNKLPTLFRQKSSLIE